MEEIAEKQPYNREDNIKPFMWKKGQSGNIMGRPKGKTMKEYARLYLERMSDDERDEWLEGIEKNKIWEMAEGKAKQEVEGNIEATLVVEISEAIAKKNGIKTNNDSSRSSK